MPPCWGLELPEAGEGSSGVRVSGGLPNAVGALGHGPQVLGEAGARGPGDGGPRASGPAQALWRGGLWHLVGVCVWVWGGGRKGGGCGDAEVWEEEVGVGAGGEEVAGAGQCVVRAAGDGAEDVSEGSYVGRGGAVGGFGCAEGAESVAEPASGCAE